MAAKILIIDDSEFNRELLTEMLQDEYQIIEASNGAEALKIIEKESDSLYTILLDLVMPKMDGFELLQRLNEKKLIGKTPILVISSENNIENEQACFELGVMDFISRPYDENIVKKRIDNMAKLMSYQLSLEELLKKKTETLRAAYDELNKQKDQIEQQNISIIETLGAVVEYRHVESGEHVKRVKGYTKILAMDFKDRFPEYGLTDHLVNVIALASTLHDLGKVAIPDAILMKPGKLTDEEFEQMKTHTTSGCEIVENIGVNFDPDMKRISREIIRSHHERFDGKGYPDGLKGDDIPISAQIVSLADVYDALTHERCYKASYTPDEAYNMIINGECGTFSPMLIDTYKHVKDKMAKFNPSSPSC